MKKTRVFADTNVILESFRIGCWTAVSTHFAIETVEKCVEETLTGNASDSNHIKVSNTELKKGLAAEYPVTNKDLASLVLYHPSCSALDDGEMHLFAWILANKQLPSPINFITTADKAALIATHDLKWLNCAVSLEHLAEKAGVNRTKLNDLRLHYRDNWLSSKKTAIRLGVSI